MTGDGSGRPPGDRRTAATGGTARWYDDAAGPVVRPYAMTRGRTRGADDGELDLIAVVIADEALVGPSGAALVAADRTLSPEHLDIVELARTRPQSIAELATDLDLPVGVVRVLVGDLLDARYVRVTRPVPPAELPDENILRDVIDALRAL
ncbi:DUF742 domain-containing protein [Streptomyces sp. UNOC14_S4]|uniref:DUF742 domain-containing protein n=1 Tax=Streptomyces sp. UNOC14_S4 TaxID=2872340 RepID=UPI001E37DB0E|nr:DUF742 domain-containing protein [Streptomyces sp. UNOC14_S4]MCC3767533.1 DUF742 domain-containing protein [Streptomyces sp. UNOC14_S4]